MTTPTDQTRRVILGLIVIGVVVFLVYYIGVPAWGNDRRSYIPDHLPSREQYDREPPYGSPGSEYDYYSLYGWRTNPPNEYPQKTINTPYDISMRECSSKCRSGLCLEECHRASLKIAISKSPSPESGGSGIEGYSEYTRSLPSHTSPRYRLSSEEVAPFCFYR